MHAIDPPLPIDYTPSARVKRQLTMMWIVVALCVGLPVVLGGLAVLVWMLRGR